MKTVSCILALAALALSANAAAHQHPASDGYSFERKEFVHTDFRVRVVIHPDRKDLTDAMPGRTHNLSVRAWVLIKPDGTCVIHIIDQAKSYTPDAIGHELTHCIYGRWHQ